MRRRRSSSSLPWSASWFGQQRRRRCWVSLSRTGRRSGSGRASCRASVSNIRKASAARPAEKSVARLVGAAVGAFQGPARLASRQVSASLPNGKPVIIALDMRVQARHVTSLAPPKVQPQHLLVPAVGGTKAGRGVAEHVWVHVPDASSSRGSINDGPDSRRLQPYTEVARAKADEQRRR